MTSFESLRHCCATFICLPCLLLGSALGFIIAGLVLHPGFISRFLLGSGTTCLLIVIINLASSYRWG